jgi:hypothetical protein
MTTEKSSPGMDLQQLLEQARVIRVISRATRARVLKRAHLSILPGAALAPAPAVSRRVGVAFFAWLGGAAAAMGVAGAAIAFHGPSRAAEPPALASSTAAACVQDAAPAVSVSAISPALVPPARSTAELARQPRPATLAESYAAELELLQRAHAAFKIPDYGTTLRLLMDHARRFPNGRLAEEREALRVRALSGSGRVESARVAASAFALRFPRSVFLTRLPAALDTGSAKTPK